MITKVWCMGQLQFEEITKVWCMGQLQCEEKITDGKHCHVKRKVEHTNSVLAGL